MRAARRAWLFAPLTLLAAGLSAAPARAQDAPPGEKYALLIGVKTYAKGDLRNLQYTEADLDALAGVLVKAGYPRANITLMTQKAGATKAALNPTLANIRATVKRWLADRGEKDTLLIAFAGHGVQFRGSKVHFFCPADAKLAEPETTMLPVSEVYEQLQQSKAGVKLLLVDACRNDPLVDQSRGAGGAKLPVVKLKSDFRPDAVSEGGALALYSCSRGEKAYEHEQLGHSVFYHFLNLGLGGKADEEGNRDGKVSLPELLEYVQRNVPKFAQREFHVRQLPELQGTLRGTLTLALLAKRPGDPERPAGQLKPEQPEGPRQLLALSGHTGQVWSVALSPNGRLAASASGDQTARLWDARSGQELRTLIGHAGAVEAVAFAPAGTLLATGGEDKVIRVWGVNDGKEKFRLSGHQGHVRSVAFSADGKWLVSGAVDASVRLWDLNTRRERWRFDGHTAAVYAVAVEPDRGAGCWRILSGGHDKTVRYWAIEKGKEEWRATHNGVVYGVAISPDGRWGLSGSADHTMRLWNLKTGAQVRSFRHPTEVNGVAFAPDSRYAVSACDDGIVRVWDLTSGEVRKSFTGHTKLVYAVAYAHDGRTALSGSFDNSVRLWALAGATGAAEPPPVFVDRADLQISVRWNTPSDVDLHVIEPDGTKCYYGRKKTAGGCLLKDVVDGTAGPEQYQAIKAASGTYRVKLHYYSGPLQGQTTPTQVTIEVRRFVGTARAETYRYTRTLTRKDQVEDVCTIEF